MIKFIRTKMMWEVWGRGIAGVSVDGGEYKNILVVIGGFKDGQRNQNRIC